MLLPGDGHGPHPASIPSPSRPVPRRRADRSPIPASSQAVCPLKALIGAGLSSSLPHRRQASPAIPALQARRCLPRAGQAGGRLADAARQSLPGTHRCKQPTRPSMSREARRKCRPPICARLRPVVAKRPKPRLCQPVALSHAPPVDRCAHRAAPRHKQLQNRPVPEQCPIRVNQPDRTSCCSNASFVRNFDPGGSKRAQSRWRHGAVCRLAPTGPVFPLIAPIVATTR